MNLIYPFFKKKFEKITLIGILSLSLFISCKTGPEKSFYRIGIFPQWNYHLEKNLIISEILSDALSSSKREYIYIASPEWISSSLEWDSLADPDYLFNHCQRIGIDELHLIDILSDHGDQIRIEKYLFKTDSITTSQTFQNQNLSELMKTCALSIRRDSSISEIIRDDDPEKHLWSKCAHARLAHFQHHTENAVALWREILATDIQSAYIHKRAVKALLDNALILQQQDGYSEHIYLEIEFLLNQLKDFYPDDAEIDFLFGRLYIQKEFWNKAQLSLMKAYQQMGDNPFLLYYMAHMYPSRYDKTGYHDKVEILKAALEIHPGFDDAWLMLGNFYFGKGKKQKAEDAFQKMLHFHPGALDALLALGKLYMLENDFVQIVKVYEQILKHYPDYSDAYYNLGIAYLRDEKVKTAKALFHRAIHIDNHRDAHYYLGMIYYEQSCPDSARIHFNIRLALRQNQDDEFANESLSMLAKINTH